MTEETRRFPSQDSLRRESLGWSGGGASSWPQEIFRYEVPESIKFAKASDETCYCGEVIHYTNVSGFLGCPNGHFRSYNGSEKISTVLRWQADRAGEAAAEETGHAIAEMR